MQYIRIGQADLKGNIGNRVFLTFLARDVAVRLQKDNITKFVVFNMVDKSTVIEARVFGASDEMIELIQEGKVYDAAIDIKPYDKSPMGFSCIVYNMDFSNIPPEYFADWAEGLEDSRKIIEVALGDCYDTVYGKITYPIILEYWDKFSKWTAASNQHHTQLGGLLTHTAEVVRLCNMIADYFNDKYGEHFINKPLLLCSAILHDIGKTIELDVNTFSGKTEYSTHSVLSTHIMDILSMVDLKAKELGIGYPKENLGETANLEAIANEINGINTNEKLAKTLEDEKEAVLLLKHCLAAHHGKLEYGSPILASIPEAVILNAMDELDATMYKYNRAFKDLEPGTFSSVWGNGGYIKFYKEISKTPCETTNIGDERHE